MAQLPTSGIKLFKLFGIQVYLHWTWFLVAIYGYQVRRADYTTPIWPALEYLALFVIVLMHEFGHALACRSVGGQAERIMLWPLGGVAFVNPPQRAGAVLWSIVAGPLVNVVLVPVTFIFFVLIESSSSVNPDVHTFFWSLVRMNGALLLFNMLPIYPLDGGQILRALLWFAMGPVRSLMIASLIGLIGSGLGIVLALLLWDPWIMLIAIFAAMQSYVGFQRSRGGDVLAPTMRTAARCPACNASPPAGPFWTCPCGKSFDVFESKGVCPNCGGMFAVVPCPTCRRAAPPQAWFQQQQAPLPIPPLTARTDS